jgi:3-phenylpropionate/trans-cinnamate dioxygenase ferredoxin reductase component
MGISWSSAADRRAPRSWRSFAPRGSRATSRSSARNPSPPTSARRCPRPICWARWRRRASTSAPKASTPTIASTCASDTRAESIDTTAKTVTAGGETIPYDHLALTTGSTPRRLPAAIGGELNGRLHRPHARRRRRHGAPVRRRPPRPHRRRRLHRARGGGRRSQTRPPRHPRRGRPPHPPARRRPRHLRLVPRAPPRPRCRHPRGRGPRPPAGRPPRRSRRAPRRRHRTRPSTSSSSASASPRTPALAEAAGIACEDGILVDDHGRTSAPGVWAAGDCARLHYRGAPPARIRAERHRPGRGRRPQHAWRERTLHPPAVVLVRPVRRPPPDRGLNLGWDNIVVRPGEGESVSHWYYAGDRCWPSTR